MHKSKQSKTSKKNRANNMDVRMKLDGENMNEFTSTQELMDKERENMLKRRGVISKIALKIEEIFLSEDLTMGELSEVMDLFNARAHSVFSKMKLKTIKENYGRS